MRCFLNEHGIRPAGMLNEDDTGRIVSVAGAVTHRQKPPTAQRVTFISLEDETGLVNVTCSAGLRKRFCRTLMNFQALRVRGVVEDSDGATGIYAHHVSGLILPVETCSRDFR